jgi:hypothetical protein
MGGSGGQGRLRRPSEARAAWGRALAGGGSHPTAGNGPQWRGNGGGIAGAKASAK